MLHKLVVGATQLDDMFTRLINYQSYPNAKYPIPSSTIWGVSMEAAQSQTWLVHVVEGQLR